MINDRKLGLLFLVMGLLFAFIIVPAQSPTQVRDSSDVPSWLMPVAGSVVIAIAGGILLLTSSRDASVSNTQQHTKTALLGLAGAALYFILAQLIGYIVVTMMFMTLYLRFVTRHDWVKSVGMSAIFCAAVYGMFELGFRIRLPAGLLF